MADVDFGSDLSGPAARTTDPGSLVQCVDRPSPIANRKSGYAIGNCLVGWNMHVTTLGGPAEGAYWYRGRVANASFDGCGWIRTDNTHDDGLNDPDTCPGGDVADGSIIKVANCLPAAVSANGASECTDGTAVLTKTSCSVHLNVRPWLANQSLSNPGPSIDQGQAVAWRYVAPNPVQGTTVVMVHRLDSHAGGSEAAWVFVPRSCLPDRLPLAAGDHYFCPALSTAANQAGQCSDPLLDTTPPGGSPADSDGDGYPDSADQCPNAAGTVSGCPDADGDGIPDRDDACPYVSGSATRSGCAPARPAVTRDAATGNKLVAYVGADRTIYIQFWNGSSWTTEGRGGEPVALGTSPAVVRDWSTGRTEIYYTGADGHIWEHAYVNGVWTNENRGSEPAFNATSPSVVRDAANNLSIIAYTGADRAVWLHVWYQGAWSVERRSGQLAAVSTSPAIVRAAGGRTDVFYHGSDGQLWEHYFNGASWSSEARGGQPIQAGASPAAVEDPSGNRIEAFYVGADGYVWERFWNGSTWSNENRGGVTAAAGTTPSVARDATGNRTLVAYTGSNNYIALHLWTGSAWSSEQHTGQPVATGASPSLAWDPAASKADVYYTGSDNGLWLWYGIGAGWLNEPRA